ncbi:hypothetical protein I3F58_05240 [Streptomyces sp. MUM 203J]|uniref:hypothetical protein n=1 Tax=Streptomyces sp. MUM 203J TaxID=2791990 RepID=UPI001F044A27|nr:hypothetical protein [Streptomyces sp. MUM 203J]MCH0538968.1 hypothetical protein [Streptomyces sp. MUM 203J]
MKHIRHTLHTLRKTAAAGVALAAGGVLALSGSAQATDQGASYMGCPSGYVCLYPNASWNGGNPSHKWYRYGSYNLSNQYGMKRFFNNQTGDAKARNCLGTNGTRCLGNQRAGTYADYDYTPYNSVKLEP